jgi:hypothetical protein
MGGRRREDGEKREAPRPIRGGVSGVTISRHGIAAGLLALVVLFEGVPHLAERSGSWATSVPAHEYDESPADGHVVWLEGLPLQEDSATFLVGLEVMFGRKDAAAITAYARSGRLAYPFLVSLMAPLTGKLGSLYAAFAVVNLLFWWAGSLAVYDLSRRATGSWWAGVLAGLLVATGIGFTYMVGNAMSAAAAYGAVPVVLWLMERLRVFREGSRWTDDVLTGCITAGVGLLNSLAPFFLCFAALFYVGRVELRRLLLWAMLVLGIGEGLGRLLRWVGRPPSDVSPPADLRVTLLIAVAVALLVVLARLPRRWGEWAVACGATAVGVGLLVLAVAAPGRALAAADVALAGLHLPDYLTGVGKVIFRVGGAVSGSWREVPEVLLRGIAMDLNFLAAFPLPVIILAALGFAALPFRWQDWCAAVLVSAGLVTFLMNAATGAPHPRLMYVAFPAVYLCAAQGLWSLHGGVRWLLDRWSWPAAPAMGRAVATAAVIVCLLAVAVPSNASLWGDWRFDRAFHFLEFD